MAAETSLIDAGAVVARRAQPHLYGGPACHRLDPTDEHRRPIQSALTHIARTPADDADRIAAAIACDRFQDRRVAPITQLRFGLPDERDGEDPPGLFAGLT